MTKRRERITEEQLTPGLTGEPRRRMLPVSFFFRLGICRPRPVFAEGRSLAESRRNIPDEDVPRCPHGVMHSSRRSRPN